MAKNPFKPSFGITPPLLVGRDDLLEAFQVGLDDGPGNPARATIYSGGRGVGKTVLINAVEDIARAQGWLVISETANVGLARRLRQEWLPGLLMEHADMSTRTRLTGLGLLTAGSLSWETQDRFTVTQGLRTLMTELLDVLARNETGLLLTLDELRAPSPDLQELLPIVQHMFREERDFALVAAGLPDAVDDLIKEPGMTFLQRAAREHLTSVPLDDVALAIRTPVFENGRVIDDATVGAAARATGGYPFMIQLVGYYAWNQRDRSGAISAEDVERGSVMAGRRVGSLVHAPSLKGLSPVATSYLLAMAVDDGPSRTADVASRMGVTPGYGSQYRKHLIDRDLIRPVSHGLVEFTLPGLREYLREHAAILTVTQ